MLLYILAGSCVALAFFTALLRNRRRERARLAAKLAASLLFCLVAVLAAARRAEPMNARATLMLAALGLGLVGDAMLGLDRFMSNENRAYVMLVGGAPFFFGHILYIIALLPYGNVNPWLLLLLPVLPCLFLLIHKFFGMGKTLIPMLVYALVLGGMMILTLNIALPGGPLGRLMALPGVLFAVSDSSLFLGAYGKERVRRYAPLLSYAVSVPYFTAQALFALSVTYL